MQKSKRKLFVLFSLGHSFNEMGWMIIPFLLPIIREEFHLTYTQAGISLAFFSLAFSVFSMISGYLKDIYKVKKILSFGFLSTGVMFSLLFLTHSYLQLIIVLTMIGVGLSIFHPVGIPLFSKSWKTGIHFGFFEVAAALGVFIMAALLPSLITFLGWRLTSLILALPNLPIGFLFLTYWRNMESAGSTSNSKKNSSIGAKSLILFYIGLGIQGFGGMAVFSFLPLFAVDVGGLLPEKASFFHFFLQLGAIPGTLILGILSDYYSPLKIIFFLALITIPMIFIVTLSSSLLIIFGSLAILGVCVIGKFVPQDVWLSQVTSQKNRGKAFGGIMSLLGLTRVLSPLAFGFLADKWGLIASFRCAILPIVIGTLLLGRLASKEQAEEKEGFQARRDVKNPL